MSDPKEKDEEKKAEGEEVPESWSKFLDLVRKVVTVPKEEIERIEKEDQRYKHGEIREEGSSQGV